MEDELCCHLVSQVRLGGNSGSKGEPDLDCPAALQQMFFDFSERSAEMPRTKQARQFPQRISFARLYLNPMNSAACVMFPSYFVFLTKGRRL